MADQVEVLESIRDVLSGKDTPKKDAPADKDGGEVVEETAEDEEEILDLTKMVNDDGSITEIGEESAAEDAKEVVAEEKPEATEETKVEETTKDKDGDMADDKAAEAKPEEKGDDVLDEIDKLLEDDKPAEAAADIDPNDLDAMFAEAPAPAAEPAAESAEVDPNDLDAMFAEAPAAAPEAAPAEEKLEPITDDSVELELTEESKPAPAEEKAEESLVSSESVDKAKDAIAGLIKVTGKDEEVKPNTPSPSFRNGETVEDLVMESLKPMLAKWLDENLGSLVEEIVQKEIARIIPK